MKKIKLINAIILLVTFSFSLNAQKAGRIDYVQTINLHKNLTGAQAALKAMVPETMETKFKFVFNEKQARISEVKEEKAQKKTMMMQGGSANCLIDFKTSTIKNLHKIGSKEYITEEKLDLMDMKLGSETKEILGYTCHKSLSEGDLTFWIATDLKVAATPMMPLACKQGAILEIESDKISYKATKLTLKQQEAGAFNFNTSARVISEGQLKDLRQEQMEEMTGGSVHTIQM